MAPLACNVRDATGCSGLASVGFRAVHDDDMFEVYEVLISRGSCPPPPVHPLVGSLEASSRAAVRRRAKPYGARVGTGVEAAQPSSVDSIYYCVFSDGARRHIISSGLCPPQSLDAI